jgi:hypothetical protein
VTPAQGEDCVASFDNLQPIRLGFLTHRVGALAIDERQDICRALQLSQTADGSVQGTPRGPGSG